MTEGGTVPEGGAGRTVEAPLYRLLAATIELTWLATLWLVASLPVITAPAATVALFRLARSRSRDRVGARQFVAALRAGFGRSTMIGGLWLVAGVVVAGDLSALSAAPDPVRVGAGAILIAVGVGYLAATPYLFVALAETDGTGPRIVRAAVLATLGTPATAVRCLIVLVGCGTAVIIAWPLIFVVPALGASVLGRLCHGPITAATVLAAR